MNDLLKKTISFDEDARYGFVRKFISEHGIENCLELGSGHRGGNFYFEDLALDYLGADDFGYYYDNEKNFVLPEKTIQYNIKDKLPFSEKKFDLIFTLDTVEHLNDDETLENLLKESTRVARKYVILGFPNGKYARFIDYLCLLSRFPGKIIGYTPPFWLFDHQRKQRYDSYKLIEKFLADNNLNYEKVYQLPPFYHLIHIAGTIFLRNNESTWLSQLFYNVLIAKNSIFINNKRGYRYFYIINL
ncbi:class I SAM-dependent methyltransferase [Patescibacteria group bacterium]|nr:class I SAM-dependent methyltransferase [Patescibacteria group bacterium]